jgi:hypothetical protein
VVLPIPHPLPLLLQPLTASTILLLLLLILLLPLLVLLLPLCVNGVVLQEMLTRRTGRELWQGRTEQEERKA